MATQLKQLERWSAADTSLHVTLEKGFLRSASVGDCDELMVRSECRCWSASSCCRHGQCSNSCCLAASRSHR